MINSLFFFLCDFFPIPQLVSGSFGCKVQVFPAFIFSHWFLRSGLVKRWACGVQEQNTETLSQRHSYSKPQPFFPTLRPAHHYFLWVRQPGPSTILENSASIMCHLCNHTGACTQKGFLLLCCLDFIFEPMFCMWNWVRQWSRGHIHAVYVCCSYCHMSTEFWLSQVFVSSARFKSVSSLIK